MVFKADTVKIDSTFIAGKSFPEAPSQYTQEFIAGDYDKVVTERVLDGVNHTIERTAYKDVKLIKCKFHPFINAMHVAYEMHLPFVISPDMIWLMIAQGFAAHIGNDVEKMKGQFVGFNRKKEISFEAKDYPIGNPLFNWENLFKQFSDSIEANTGKGLLDLVSGSFSTTTPIEKAAFQVTLMDALSDYFNYTF